LAELPSLVPPEQRPQLNREVLGATRDRMLREFCAVLEAFSAAFPLALVLEDLQWADASTLDLIAAVARRREPARLLLLATYRPREAPPPAPAPGALARDLQRRGCAAEIALSPLSEADVAAYLAARFPGGPLPERLAEQLTRFTGGNPLFMVTWTDYLVAQGLLINRAGAWVLAPAADLAERGVPPALGELIEHRLDQLPLEEREVLEAASVVGAKFPVSLVAAALGIEIDDAED